jgi:hypothetical protein
VDPIVVPAPPRAAYNPNRRVSDLILGQLKHFQHVELSSGDLGIDPELARNIYTEGGAALYIAAVTNALRMKDSATAAPAKLKIVSRTKPAKTPRRAEPLSIAAAASETTSRAQKKTPAKKTSASPTTKPGGRSNKGTP